MSDIDIRIQGLAGHITLNRPSALNALTYDMLRTINAALIDWAEDDAVRIVILDASGDKAFCAGGDIADLYANGKRGDYAFGHRFWRDEYRLNDRIKNYPKPVVSFLHGFTMGGGVGIGCHGSHRILCESSQIAMPEVSIGLVPDVGGSLLLANAPGNLGRYLGLTGARMDADIAILSGFAEHFVPRGTWDQLKQALMQTGDVASIATVSHPAPPGPLRAHLDQIETLFAAPDLGAILTALTALPEEFASATLKQMRRNSPLSLACTIEILHRLQGEIDIRTALDLEYRYTYRASEHGDFLEGIRAVIIDKDRTPQWRHALGEVPTQDVDQMLAPLGSEALTFQ